MNNKILVKVMVPKIGREFEVFIPVNRSVGNLIKIFTKAVTELYEGDFPKMNRNIYNRIDGTSYNHDTIVKDSNIKNGTTLIFY